MKVANSPLFIEDIPGNHNEIQRGSSVKRRVIVNNLGDIKAEVDIWIAATDNKSDPLLRWCTFSEQNPLSIEAKGSKEVTLNFQIPQQANLDIYNYEILIEAATQYPGKIFRRPQQLRVLPSNKDVEFGSEPAFSIQPVTTSANPLPLQVGESLELKVKVENRSKRVERFYINCPDLSQQWYTVSYPESSLDILGLVKETEGLELNPGGNGEITLILHPPQYTPAGNYFPTINLISSNRQDLVLLDVVYLQILPDERLNLQVRPLSRKYPQEGGEFELELSNLGNIRRELKITAKDEEELFSYYLQPSVLQILPGQKQKVALKAKPKKGWRRQWWGKGLTFPFNIEVENFAPQVGEVHTPALPNNLPQPTIVWQSRAWWQFWALILLALLSLGGIGYLVWLKFFNTQLPQVISLNTSAKEFQQGNANGIPLTWRINNPSEVKKVTVITQEGSGEIERKNYEFPNVIPNDYKLENGKCEIKQEKLNEDAVTGMVSQLIPGNSNKNKTQDVLTCQVSNKIPQKAGNYTYKIEVFSKKNREQTSSSQTTDTFAVKPQPLPQITELSSTQPSYQEVSTAPRLPNNSTTPGVIRLNWKISNPSQIKELRIVGFAPDNSVNSVEKRYQVADLGNLCTQTEQDLICQNVPTNAIKAGDYRFKLTVIPTQGEVTPEITKDSPTIKIVPQPAKPATPAKILSFRINNQEVGKTLKFAYPINKQGSSFIRLSWQVQNGEDIKVELMPFGKVEPQGERTYPLDKTPGSKTFTLTVTNKAGQSESKPIEIETFEPNQPNQPQAQPSGQTSGNNSSPTAQQPSNQSPLSGSNSGVTAPGSNSSSTAPKPWNSGKGTRIELPNKLAPIELPPQAD